MSRLATLRIAGGDWDSGAGVFAVSSQHALAQAAGYLKYALSAEGPVYFRGQTSMYPTMLPSLFRGCVGLSAMRKRLVALGTFRNDVRRANAFITGTPEYAHDALLQHYGIRTPWLDLVDNLWVALWFACHDAVGHGKAAEYLHFERRRADPSKFAYVALFHCHSLAGVQKSPGLWQSTDLEVIDLRIAAPSLYLRPHAQHGLLVRRRAIVATTDSDLLSSVVGWLRAPLPDAIEWLGSGTLVSTHTLFPPPKYDGGCDKLLARAPKPKSKLLGAVQHVGA
jgi:hypothetical protein